MDEYDYDWTPRQTRPEGSTKEVVRKFFLELGKGLCGSIVLSCVRGLAKKWWLTAKELEKHADDNDQMTISLLKAAGTFGQLFGTIWLVFTLYTKWPIRLYDVLTNTSWHTVSVQQPDIHSKDTDPSAISFYEAQKWYSNK